MEIRGRSLQSSTVRLRHLTGCQVLRLCLCAALVACGDSNDPTTRVSTVEILPHDPLLVIPATLQLSALARDTDGAEISGRTVIWSSSNGSVATVTQTGLVTGHSRGTSSIRARIDGVEGGTLVTVQLPVATITITPSVDTVAAYDTVAFTATAADENGASIPDPPLVWSVTNISLASIDQQGVVTTIQPGTVTVRAMVGTVIGEAMLRINPPRVASVEIRAFYSGARPLTELPVRVAERYGAFTYDSKGNWIQGRVVEWQSSSPSAISITDSGWATALSTGMTTLTATSEGVSSPGVGVAVLVMPPLISLAVGDYQTCAVGTDNGAYCWGSNNYGALGVGDIRPRPGPVLVSGGYRWKAVAVGDEHTCGLTEAGMAYCWGRNHQGQLGTGTIAESRVPIAVIGGLTFETISAGNAYTCAVTAGHDAYCWGSNGNGQLGNGTTVPSLVPTPVQGAHEFRTVSNGRGSPGVAVVSCGVTTTGGGYCWGTNNDGQLGTGDSTSSTVPSQVSGMHDWAEISASMFQECGRDVIGQAYCWGANPYGAFGNGTTISDPRPTPFGAGSYQSMSAGSMFSCGVDTNGGLWCSGQNVAHQLGVDGPYQLESPINPAPSLQFSVVRAGLTHACALSVIGQAWCWGDGVSEYAGYDETPPVRRPFKVVGQI